MNKTLSQTNVRWASAAVEPRSCKSRVFEARFLIVEGYCRGADTIFATLSYHPRLVHFECVCVTMLFQCVPSIPFQQGGHVCALKGARHDKARQVLRAMGDSVVSLDVSLVYGRVYVGQTGRGLNESLKEHAYRS